MQIKPPSRKHLQRAILKQRNPHWWLVDEQPRKAGRLGQLNKANRRNRVESEFVKMAKALENVPSGKLFGGRS